MPSSQRAAADFADFDMDLSSSSSLLAARFDMDPASSSSQPTVVAFADFNAYWPRLELTDGVDMQTTSAPFDAPPSVLRPASSILPFRDLGAAFDMQYLRTTPVFSGRYEPTLGHLGGAKTE